MEQQKTQLIDVTEVGRRLKIGRNAVSARIQVGTLPRPTFEIVQGNGRPRGAWQLTEVEGYLPRRKN
jgi:hypothetical protein